MDIRNWMQGSTKRSKSQQEPLTQKQTLTQEKAPIDPPVGQIKVDLTYDTEEDILKDSDEDFTPHRKKQKTPSHVSREQSISLDFQTQNESKVSLTPIAAKSETIAGRGALSKPSPQRSLKRKSDTLTGGSGDVSTPAKCFDDMKIAVTGVPSMMSREEIEEFILQNGGKIASSVSGKTSLLIVGRLLEDGRPVTEGNKYKTALEKKVAIMSEEDFFEKYNPVKIRSQQQHQQQLQQLNRACTVKKATSASSLDTSLWVDKYRPKAAIDLIGHGETVRKLTDWLKSWNDVHLLKKFKPTFSKENPGARAVLLSGPPGIGKTSLASLVAGLLHYDILELNASDTRNKAEIDQILIEAVSSRAISQSSFFPQTKSKDNTSSSSSSSTVKSRVVIMDEVDGMGGSDRGGISELIKIIKISKIPIICICNDRQSPKVKGLANNCFDLRVKRPTKSQIALRLVQIASQEGLQVDANAAEMLVEQSGNDIRQALNALQMWAMSGRSMTYQDVKEGMHRIEKDKVLRQSPFDACLTILSGGKQGGFDERYNSFFIDYSLVPLLIQQNYVDSSKSGIFRNPQMDDIQKMEQLSLAADAVSDLDMVGSKIRGLDQHWELLPTQAAFSVKVGFHVQGFQAFPSFPAWLGKYSSTTKKQRLTKEIVHHTCLSVGQGFLPIRLDYIPFLRNALLHPLLSRGKDGALQTIEMLDQYDLSKEDFSDSLREMQFKVENDKTLIDRYDLLDTQTKTALTKLYNSMSHKSSTITQAIGPKKSKRASASTVTEEDFLDDDGEIVTDGALLNEVLEEEEEEDIEALRAEMNKSLNKSKAKSKSKSLTTEKKSEGTSRKNSKKK